MVTGCSSTPPTSSTVAPAQPQPSENQTQITTTQPIIAYYDLESNYSATPVKGGFYRILLGRDHQGRFLAQDFFTDSKQKQTDPFWLDTITGFYDFGTDHIDSFIQSYYKNGKLHFKGTYKNGEIVGLYQMFYPSGQKALDWTETDQKIHAIYYYPSGKKAAETLYLNDKMLTNQYWDHNGKIIKDDTLGEQIIEQINTQTKIGQ
ncbi:hypothetical protein BJI46_10870 [Acinetobacter qingfengensis]|uniref:Toxin-antitoxin system YwqK family antitoxin n=2 Tax=Acinetobacter qingfengensis TaxID=1262585 RepID=A0A1E7RD66_9GAMM|nr:hypothetical protein BJI46_10870 [Acinetobacter qingfengensis]